MNTLDSWISGIERSPEYRLERDNDINFQVARNLFELRRWRGYTQEEVAERMGSTQPKVAAAESGMANLTFRTFRRFIDALGGRLRISVLPAECDLPRFEPWWTVSDQVIGPHRTPWTAVKSLTGQIATKEIVHVHAWVALPASPDALANHEFTAMDVGRIEAADWYEVEVPEQVHAIAASVRK